MDIRKKIYCLIEEQGGADYDQKKQLAQALSEGDSNMLIQDLDRFYKRWLDAQHIKEHTEERARLEYIQETCFEVTCEALALQGDPSVIPYFLKYVPKDDWDPKTEVNMEDYNTQNLTQCIASAEYYGERYIPVLLAHIHEVVPDKIESANKFFYSMLTDDLVDFQDTHPFFCHLYLAKKYPFQKILDYSLENALYYLRKNETEKVKFIQEIINNPIEKIEFEDNPVIKIAYVQQQFLKLHASD